MNVTNAPNVMSNENQTKCISSQLCSDEKLLMTLELVFFVRKKSIVK